jgi:outer membrane protein
MKLKTLSLAIALSSLSFAVQTNAATLVQVYQDALHNDPTFKEARATWMSQEELTPIARASFLPSLSLSSSWGHTNTYQELAPGAGNKNKSANLAVYELTASQPIFNLNSWAQLSNAQNTAKSAAATFNAAAQNLIYRTATAYFDVLTAVNDLQTTVAEKNDYLQQLKTTSERYKVGLVAITPLYEAEASYDAAVADEIAKRNAVTAKMEALRAITGHTYSSLTEFANQVPLLKPNPDNIDIWVGMAMRNNYSLIAQHYLNLAAMANVKVQSSAILPALSATDTLEKQVGAAVTSGATPESSNFVGLSLSFPVFANGGVSFVKTKQARYNYASQYAVYEQTYSQLLSSTRTDFLSVATGRRQILADAKSVQSNEKNVETTEASYRVGTSTMDDVLEAYSELYKSKALYAKDQYNFLAQTLQLKDDGGMLSFTDLQAIDNTFKRTVYFHQLVNGDYQISYTNINGGGGDGSDSDGSGGGRIKPSVTSKPQIKHPKPIKQYDENTKNNFKTVYTIQLMASKDLQGAQSFMAKHDAGLHLSLNSTTVDGEKWYTVDYGSFATRPVAEHALRQLSQFSHLSPWVTTVHIKVNAPTHSARSHSAVSHKKNRALISSNKTVPAKQKHVDASENNASKNSTASNSTQAQADTNDDVKNDVSDNVTSPNLPQPAATSDDTQQQPINNSSAKPQGNNSISDASPSASDTTATASPLAADQGNSATNTVVPSAGEAQNSQQQESDSISNVLPSNGDATDQQSTADQSDGTTNTTVPSVGEVQNSQQQANSGTSNVSPSNSAATNTNQQPIAQQSGNATNTAAPTGEAQNSQQQANSGTSNVSPSNSAATNTNQQPIAKQSGNATNAVAPTGEAQNSQQQNSDNAAPTSKQAPVNSMPLPRG